jgi:hypothetical protein
VKYWFWIILLLPASALFAKDKKLGGYVLDPVSFRVIQSYCIDTHNLPPREVKVINQFIARESKPTGLLARLPWHRLGTCQEANPDAIVRLEFPYDHSSAYFVRHDIQGALIVFRPGSPSPIYETQALPPTGESGIYNDRSILEVLERNALESVTRALIHDWQKLSETPRDAPS